MDGMWVDDKTLTPGVFGFRTLDDTNAMLEYAQEHRRAVVIGGGLLGLEAAYGLQQHGLRGARRAVRAGADEPAARRGGRRDPAQGRRAAGHHGAHSASGPPRCAAAGTVSGVVFADGSSIDCDMVVVTAGHPAQRRARRRLRAHRGTGDRRRRPDARGRRPRHLRGRGVRAAPRRGVRAGRPAVGTGDRARRPHHRRRPEGGLPRLADRHEAQGRRGRPGVDGRQAPGEGGRRVRPVLRAAPRRLQVGGDPRRQAGGRHPARRRREGRVPHPELRPRPSPARGTGGAALRAGRTLR